MSWIAFGVVAAALLGGAVAAVTSTDLVRSVLYLGVVLAGTAVAYVLLHADFLAVVQVLLYTGGVITLMLFAVMLTPGRGSGDGRPVHGSRPPLRGLVVSTAVVLLVGAAILGGAELPEPAPAGPADTAALARLFLTDLAVPFEALSVLLLAVMVGAIALARRDGGRRPATLRREIPGRSR